MVEKQSKNSRTLDMYVRLCEGKAINKSDEASDFGVDERSIQRDIDDIRAFLENIGQVPRISYGRLVLISKNITWFPYGMPGQMRLANPLKGCLTPFLFSFRSTILLECFYC